MEDNFISNITQILSNSEKIVLIPHKNPDGDAIGASLALFHFFCNQKKEAIVVTPNDYASFLKWMPGAKATCSFEHQEAKCRQELAEADVIFYLDFNALDRVGDKMQSYLKQLSSTKLMIDHHEQPTDIAHYSYSDPLMSSTCEMVYEFIQTINPKKSIDSNIATCLYTGIMTDTGSFRFPATTSKTHQVVANLIDCGADNSSIHSKVYDNKSIHRLQLLGKSLSNLQVINEYNTAFICLSKKDLNSAKHQKGDTEGIVNYALSLQGIAFAVLFTEDLDQNLIKISFRSKGTFSVNNFARKYFEGGGHENAAGGRSFKNMNQTIAFFKELLPLHQEDLLNSYE